MGGDASESDGGDVLAGIDVEAGTWHAELMGVVAGALGAVCGDEFGGLTAEEFIVAAKELMTLATRWTSMMVCAVRKESELIKFVAYFGVVCEYAYASLLTWPFQHILHGLGDPLAGKLRLRRQGLKCLEKKRRGCTNKTAASIGLLSELEMHRIGGGGAAGGAGYTRAKKFKCLGWRRISRGGAAGGGAGHYQAEKHECLGWRRIGRGGAACGAGYTRAEKLKRLGGRRISRGGASSSKKEGKNTSEGSLLATEDLPTVGVLSSKYSSHGTYLRYGTRT